MSEKNETNDPFAGFIGETSVQEETPAPESAKESANDASAEEEVVDSVEEPSEKEADKEADKEDAAKKPTAKKSVEQRIAEITAKRREAERTADAAQSRIAELEAQLAAKAEKKPLTDEKRGDMSQSSAPNPEDFDYGEVDPRYVTALARYEAKQEFAEQKRLQDEARQAEAAARQAQEAQQKLDGHIAKGVEKYDDFEQALEALDAAPAVSREAAELLLSSDYASDILYHFGKNPAEAAAIASKSLIEQARIIGKLEAKFSATAAAPKKEAKITGAAPPPSGRVRGSDGKFLPSDESTDFSVFEAKYVKKG